MGRMEKRQSPLILFFILLVAIAPPAQGKSFRDYLFEESRTGRLKVPLLADSFEGEDRPEPVKSLTKYDFGSLYTKASKGLGVKKWVSVELAPYFQLPQGRPHRDFYNTHLIWGLNAQGEKLVGFRPVDTNTGCASGCAPVVFHLQVNALGKTTALLQEARHPLTKVWHEKFSAADTQKALEIARDLPAALAKIDDPEWATDSEAQFPPQTWTFLKEVVVEGAAYSSFRIYEAALKTFRTVQKGGELAQLTQKQSEVISELLNLSSVAEGKKAVEKLSLTLASEKTLPEEKHLIYRLGPHVIVWMLSQEDISTSEMEKFFRDPEFNRSRVGDFCHFQRDLLLFERGQKLLLKMLRHAEDWPVCPSPAAPYMPFLAAALLKDKARAKTLAKEINIGDSPEFLKRDALLFAAFAQGLELLGKKDEMLQVLADFSVHFPRAELPVKVLPTEMANFQRYQNEKSIIYQGSLRPLFQAVREKMPSVEALSSSGKKIKVPFAKKAALYVFFASWCPHCQQTLRSWAKLYPPEASFWKDVVLVEVFRNGGESQREAFCQLTELPTAICTQIQSLPDNAATSAFYKKISLASVPRKVLVDDKGMISIFDWQYVDAEGKDFGADLKATLELQKKR